jgi:ribosomal-protein-alanine N-acetyltransferase
MHAVLQMDKSELIEVRHLRESDRAEWLRVRRVSRALHEPWEPAAVPGLDPASDDGFDLALKTCDLPERQRFVVVTEMQEIVAQVGLSQISRGPFQNAVMGYWGSALHAGKGFVAAGVRRVLSKAFAPGPQGLGLHRVEANVIPANAASIRVVRRVGMRLEGFSPRYLEIAGKYQDHLRFALTNEEWDCARHCICEGDSGAIR